MGKRTEEADVVVVGSGLSGLVATVRALEQGTDVILLEKSPNIGGTTKVTGGYLSVNRDAEPTVDANEPFDESLGWLDEIGASYRPTEYTDREGQDEHHVRIDPPEFVNHMEGLIEEMGGDIRPNTPFKRLLTDDADEIRGVVAHDFSSGPFEVHAPSVVLATGGFSSNEELVEQLIGNPNNIWLGRDPFSTGDGFLAAKELGGKTTPELSNPHGLSRPAPPAEISFEDMRCGQIYETSSIAITDDGRRFTDESKERVGHYEFINDLIDIGGSCWLILDRDLYEDKTRYQSAVKSRLELAEDLGGTVLQADTLEDLGEKLSEHGVDGKRAIETVEKFNDAIETGEHMDLEPPRKKFLEPMNTPPLFAVHVMGAILYFVGGLDVTHKAEVVCRQLSTSSMRQHPQSFDEVRIEPINGLYAAGIEVGRHEDHGYYIGGLALALATGRIAGYHAAQRALDAKQVAT